MILLYFQTIDLSLIDIYAGYTVAAFGKASTGHQADIAGANHRNVHKIWLKGYR